MSKGSEVAHNAALSADGKSAGSTFGALTMALNVAGTLLILAMAVGVNADILGRGLFNEPIPGVAEFLGLAIVAVVFLQMANTLRANRHVSNDLIVAAIALRWPRIAHACYAIFHAIGATLMGLIVWYVYPIFRENYAGGYFKGTLGFIEIPVWPFLLVALIGGAATLIQYLILAWSELRRACERPGLQ